MRVGGVAGKALLHGIAYWPTHYKDVLGEENRGCFMMNLTTCAENSMTVKNHPN
jgi:hypothetical protein